MQAPTSGPEEEHGQPTAASAEMDMDDENEEAEGSSTAFGGAGAADPDEQQQNAAGGEDLRQQMSSASLYARQAIAARQVTEQQIQALREGGSVRPGHSLADFFKQLEDFKPVIPDSVALHMMRKNGIANPDPRIVRLFSLAVQKFISDICLDAMQQARIKGLGQVRKGTREVRYCLSNELLLPVLEEYGIKLDKPPYYQ